MIEGYVTVKEKAQEWGISERTLQAMCSQGRIEGAEKFGKAWAIPVSTKHPPDGRISTGKYINWRKKKKEEKEIKEIKKK